MTKFLSVFLFLALALETRGQTPSPGPAGPESHPALDMERKVAQAQAIVDSQVFARHEALAGLTPENYADYEVQIADLRKWQAAARGLKVVQLTLERHREAIQKGELAMVQEFTGVQMDADLLKRLVKHPVETVSEIRSKIATTVPNLLDVATADEIRRAEAPDLAAAERGVRALVELKNSQSPMDPTTKTPDITDTTKQKAWMWGQAATRRIPVGDGAEKRTLRDMAIEYAHAHKNVWSETAKDGNPFDIDRIVELIKAKNGIEDGERLPDGLIITMPRDKDDDKHEETLDEIIKEADSKRSERDKPPGWDDRLRTEAENEAQRVRGEGERAAAARAVAEENARVPRTEDR